MEECGTEKTGEQKALMPIPRAYPVEGFGETAFRVVAAMFVPFVLAKVLLDHALWGVLRLTSFLFQYTFLPFLKGIWPLVREVLGIIFSVLRTIWILGGREAVRFLWTLLRLPLRILFRHIFPAIGSAMRLLSLPFRHLAKFLIDAGILELTGALLFWFSRLLYPFARIGRLLLVVMEPWFVVFTKTVARISRSVGAILNDVLSPPVLMVKRIAESAALSLDNRIRRSLEFAAFF